MVGKFVEKAVKDTGKAIITTGETVGKFTAHQGKMAFDETKKGVELAGKALEGVAKEAYKGAAEAFLGQVKAPLEKMVKSWKDSVDRKPQDFLALQKAIQAGDGHAIQAALEQMLNDMVNNSSLGLIAKDLKDKNAGSFLVVVSAGGGLGFTGHGDMGIAIDIDYLIHVGKTGKSSGFQGAIASLFAVTGLQLGPAAGGGVDVMFGYHVANPEGVGGPSMDISLEIKAAVGGGIGVGFDMTHTPWKVNTANIGLGAGVEVQLSAGPSFGLVLGQLCGNGTFLAVNGKCPNVTKTSVKFSLQLTNHDGSKSSSDNIMDYKTWDGGNWKVKIENGLFRHAPNGDWTKSHSATIIQYQTWDGTHWTARIENGKFLHAPDGKFERAHSESFMNYISWDGGKRRATLVGKM
ncbi:MAG: DUF4751 family protein [Methylococcaceae bacterium]